MDLRRGLCAAKQGLGARVIETGAEDVLVFAYGTTPREPAADSVAARAAPGTLSGRWGTLDDASPSETDSESLSTSSGSMSSSSSAYTSESDWDGLGTNGEAAAPCAGVLSTRTSPPVSEPVQRRMNRQKTRLASFLEPAVGHAGEVVRRLSPSSARQHSTLGLFWQGASPRTYRGPSQHVPAVSSTPWSGKAFEDVYRTETRTRTSPDTEASPDALGSSAQEALHTNRQLVPAARRERVRPPPIDTAFALPQAHGHANKWSSLVALRHLTLNGQPGSPPNSMTLLQADAMHRSLLDSDASDSEPDSAVCSGRTGSTQCAGVSSETPLASIPLNGAVRFGPGEVLIPVRCASASASAAGEPGMQPLLAVAHGYPRFPMFQHAAGACPVSSSSSSATTSMSPRGAMSPPSDRREAFWQRSAHRRGAWAGSLSSLSPGPVLNQSWSSIYRSNQRYDGGRLGLSSASTATPRTACATGTQPLLSPSSALRSHRRLHRRLDELLDGILRHDRALAEDDWWRELSGLVADGLVSVANIFYRLSAHHALRERTQRSETAAYGALHITLHLILNGPLEALAEAVANGQVDFWQALHGHWHAQLPDLKSLSEAETARHWRMIFLVEVVEYLTRKLRFHESYPPFEANYALGRFFRRVELESTDSFRVVENQETQRQLFSLDTVTEMVSILHCLLDAELGLARNAGRFLASRSETASSTSGTVTEADPVLQLYREQTHLGGLLALLAQDATNLYQMVVYMMSRMHARLGKRSVSTQRSHCGTSGNATTATPTATRACSSLSGSGCTASEAADLRELAVVLQEMSGYLRKFFERLLEADLIEQVPYIPPQLLIPAPDACMVPSRFPFLVIARFTNFADLHRAIASGARSEAAARSRP